MVRLRDWGEDPIERMLDYARLKGVDMVWEVPAVFAEDPKVAARRERARSRGHKVRIGDRLPKRAIIFYGSAKGGGRR